MNPLNRVAIIMDGNEVGSKKRNSRNAGHKAGLNTVEKIIKETIKQKLDFLLCTHFQQKIGKGLKKRLIIYLICWKIS